MSPPCSEFNGEFKQPLAQHMRAVDVWQKGKPTVKVHITQLLECPLFVGMDTSIFALLCLGKHLKVLQHALLDILAQRGQRDIPIRHRHQRQLCLHGNCKMNDRPYY